MICFYYLIDFVRGTITFKNNESVSISLSSCSFAIYDKEKLSTQNLDTNYLGVDKIPHSLGEGELAFL